MVIIVDLTKEKVNLVASDYLNNVNIVSSGRQFFIAIPTPNTNASDYDLEGIFIIDITNNSWDTNIRSAYLQSIDEYMMIYKTKRYLKK